MFKFVSRSRSVKNGGSVHGPRSPDSPASLGEDYPVSSRQTSKQDAIDPQNERFPSPSVPSVGLSGNPGGSHLHPSSPPYPLSSPAPMMPERPRTSSGPGHNKYSTATSFKDFDKRKSKDDLSLMTRGTARGGFKSYHIPIRGKPPSPSDNGRDASPAPTIPVRTQTPESLPDNNAIITIGMAIGSPTHPPIASYGSNWPPQTAIGVATSTPEAEPEPEPTPAQAPQRSKSTRWKLFGRSKSKRVKPEVAQTPMPPGPPDTAVAAGIPTTSGLDRSNTDRRAPKHKPLIVRSGTEPVMESSADGARFDPRPPLASSRLAAKPVDVSASALGKSHGPLLDVEIPDITMERYSVMFGGLLQANGSSSSLLARRQATLERLRTINDRIIQEQETRDLARGRRATSPGLERSPSLSMFPTPPPTVPSPMSPRLRSATLPSGLPSNPRDGALERKRQTQMQLEVPTKASHLLQERKTKKGYIDLQNVAEQYQSQATPSQSSAFSPDQSSLILDSPTEERDPELHIKEQLRPTIYEPQWVMVSPSNSTKSQQIPRRPAIGLAQTQPSGSNPRGEASNAPNPAQKHAKKSSEEEFDEAMLNAAVEISIARQISVSQQQRDMLRKNIGGGGAAGVRRIKVPRGDRQGAASGIAGPAKSATTKNERLAATKTATPTLITPPEPFVGSPLAQHRKSERIIVEGA